MEVGVEGSMEVGADFMAAVVDDVNSTPTDGY
jgi:hypothetical protein